MGIYATVAQLRAEPEIPDAPPPSDADLEALITRAEEQVDIWLGPWPVLTTGPSDGRKIAQASVEAWRWTNLGRAVVLLAVAMYASPQVLAGPEWDEISGPDFTTKGYRGAGAKAPIVAVANVLNASGLRIGTARARP